MYLFILAHAIGIATAPVKKIQRLNINNSKSYRKPRPFNFLSAFSKRNHVTVYNTLVCIYFKIDLAVF